MKKHIFISATAVSVILLTACSSGVSEEAYQSLEVQVSEAESQLDKSGEKYNELSSEYSAYKESIEDTIKEDKVIQSWVDAYFRNSSYALDDKNNLTIHVPTDYDSIDDMKGASDGLVDALAAGKNVYKLPEFRYITFIFRDNYSNDVLAYQINYQRLGLDNSLNMMIGWSFYEDGKNK